MPATSPENVIPLVLIPLPMEVLSRRSSMPVAINTFFTRPARKSTRSRPIISTAKADSINGVYRNYACDEGCNNLYLQEVYNNDCKYQINEPSYGCIKQLHNSEFCPLYHPSNEMSC